MLLLRLLWPVVWVLVPRRLLLLLLSLLLWGAALTRRLASEASVRPTIDRVLLA